MAAARGVIGDVTGKYIPGLIVPDAFGHRGSIAPLGPIPVPRELDWDLWLGDAPERPYKAGVYHAFKWQAWDDFNGCVLWAIWPAIFWMACSGALEPGYPHLGRAGGDGGPAIVKRIPKASIIRWTHYPKTLFNVQVLYPTGMTAAKSLRAPPELEAGRELAEPTCSIA